MAFSSGFSGDVKSLQYILQTLRAKRILIPGITSNPNLQVSAMGEVAYFYKRGASTVDGTKALGSKIDFQSTGVTRVDVNLTNAIQIGAVIPHVNFATVDANVVADKVVQETMSAANEWNEKGLAYLEANATNFYKTADSTIVDTEPTNAALTKSNIYAEIVNMRKAFNIKNKAKGMKPNAILVSEAAYALLLQSDEFIRKEQVADATVFSGSIGRIAGLEVVVAQDQEKDIIMLNAEGFAAPINVKTLFVVDGTQSGWPGSILVTGELGYGFKIADEDLILVRN